MPDSELDNILQTLLAELESGVPLDQVLKETPEEAKDLIPLLKLALAVRSLPAPSLSPQAVKAQHDRIVAATQKKTRRSIRLTWLSDFYAIFVGQKSLAFAALTACILLGYALFLAGPVYAHTARLAATSGSVQLAPNSTSTSWHVVSAGEQVSQGQRIRTDAGSEVTIVFFDGSRTTLGPGTVLTLTNLTGGWGRELQVRMDQKSGTSIHDVVPLAPTQSFFSVNTPSGQASVHGTLFNVAVKPDGGVQFGVVHGKVVVRNDSSEVLLDAGQVTIVYPGQAPGKPVSASTLEETPSPTATATATATLENPTQTTTLTDIPTVDLLALPPLDTPTVAPKNDTSRCDNQAEPRPEATILAERYSTSTDAITAWFCKGFGYGEIDMAYGLSGDYGMSVSHIFALRSSGLSWGEIKDQLDLEEKSTPHGKGNQKPSKEPRPQSTRVPKK